jgi:hypothetical protein
MLLFQQSGLGHNKVIRYPLEDVSMTMREKVSTVTQLVKEAKDAFFNVEGSIIEDEFPEDKYAYGMNCAQ